jgi:hypothetical protein
VGHRADRGGEGPLPAAAQAVWLREDHHRKRPPTPTLGLWSTARTSNTAGILLGSQGNVAIKRTAMLREALQGTPVSPAPWRGWLNALTARGSMRR